MAELGSIDIGSQTGLSFAIRVPGAHGFAVALSRFGGEIADYTPFWEGRFKTWWYALRQIDYASAGGATGGMWAPLSPAYRAWKNAHYPRASLLVLSGAMKASLLRADAPGSVWRPGPRSLQVGTTVPEAFFHQVGTRRMPARPPIRFAPVDVTRLGKLLQEHAAESWKTRRDAERGSAA